ncbi:hypothetical protein MtrunA17_Chr3g0143041 [Medicago truncatula]|nr:uncharacterized protein LOC112420477 isoform X4 [Medicago truncatula]XP_024635130.1 uncharacterized protein LOC112420477 isoform X3 [Medicago truncatula]XP_024635919.1 uncharacterized protein LOC112420477 isoform X2 [Medicago truncatula]AFK35721.1 unknown [Medicago truncatula]RHN71141.1 hypothetical protein MtrunA17_Chr3g0143031 [Medicago truncatula]RHN71142.1 hypothetical protein MtrunA17_Chr3g0143041 [Medicago truncatula]
MFEEHYQHPRLSPMGPSRLPLPPQMERKLLHEKKRKEQEVESTKEDLLHGKKPKEQKVESTEGDLLYDGEKPKEFECPVYAETLKVYNKLKDIDTIDLKWCPIIPDKHAYLKHEKKFAELFKKHEEKKKRWMLIEEEKERLGKGKRGAVTDKLKPCYAMLLA